MNKYSLSMRILHWVASVMIITLLCVGAYMVGLPDGDEKSQIYIMHKSFGLITFGIIVLRIIVRLNSSVPSLPSGMKSFEVNLASVITLLLYICMVLMPLSGYVMSVSSGYGINFFGTGQMVPNLIGINPHLASIARGAHGVVAIVLASLIALHIVGAIKHLLVDKINLFRRMV